MERIIGLFNHSALLPEKFSDYLKTDQKNVVKPLVPIFTRWNSLQSSAERFIYPYPMMAKVILDENTKRSQVTLIN